jgi:hypothetical protein
MTPREFVQRRSVSEQAIALLPVHAQALLSCSL